MKTIAAVLEERVRVPQELKLVLGRNKEVDLLCPVPASFVEVSQREIAQALVAQVRKLYRGERCEPVEVGCRLIPAEEETVRSSAAKPRADTTKRRKV